MSRASNTSQAHTTQALGTSADKRHKEDGPMAKKQTETTKSAQTLTPATIAAVNAAHDSWQLPESAQNTVKAQHGGCRSTMLKAGLSSLDDATLATMAKDCDTLCRFMVAILKAHGGLRDPAGCLMATIPAWQAGKTPSAIPNGPTMVKRETDTRAKEKAKTEKKEKAKA